MVVVVVVVVIFDKRTRFLNLRKWSRAKSSGLGVHELQTVMVLNGLSLQKRCSYFVKLQQKRINY